MCYYKLILIFLCLFVISCANIQGINGGPEDKEPPRLVSEKSSPDFQLRFKDHEIILTFNEWIRLDNPGLNISISPTTRFPVEYKLKGKKLLIQFDQREIFEENTTYVIQFGESIKDITSGNIQRNIKYVFSTGDYLDSLITQIQVIDALTAKPKDKILVSLYKVLDDTAFQKIKPFYFAWTDSAGQVLITNMSPGNYRLYALEDKNQNYIYDQINEAFAFFPEVIKPKEVPDSIYKLYLSAVEIPAFIKEKKLSSGKAVIHFKERPHRVSIKCDDNSNIQFINLKDSMLVWNLSKITQNCILSFDDKKDTFDLLGYERALYETAITHEHTLLKPDQWPGFILSDPILSVDKNRFLVLDSLSFIQEVKMDSTDPRKFYITGQFLSKNQIRIVIPDGAVQSLYSNGNKLDTLSFSYFEATSLSRLKLTLDSLEPGQQYILQLINNQNISVEKIVEATLSSKILFFNYLLPGKYEIRIIHDKNRNGRWDPADFKQKQQPESLKYFELTELRADWDIDIKIKW